MSAKELYYFIARCLSLDDYPDFRENILAAFSPGGMSTEYFIAMCDRHLVLPAVYLKFKRHGLLEVFPEEYAAHLAAIYLRNKQRNLDILQQIEEICEILFRKDIQPVFLKGTAHLLDGLYSDPGERMIGDIDLLVREGDYLHSAELIKSLGYRPPEYIFSDVTDRTHYPPLIREDSPVHVEIHRLPVNKPEHKWFTPEASFEMRKSIPGMVNCFVQSNRHQLLQNFIHSQLSNLGYAFGFLTLRDLYDFYLHSKRVDREDAIAMVPEPEKLKYMYAQVDRMMLLDDEKLPYTSRYIQSRLRRFDWLMEHPGCHKALIFIIKVWHTLWMRFIPGMFEILFSRKKLGRLFKNFTNPAWYNMLLFRISHFYRTYIARGRSDG